MTGEAATAIPTIGVVCGGDDAPNVVWDWGSKTGGVGNNDSMVMLKHLLPGVELRRMHLAPSYLRQPRRHNFSACDLIWNSISDEIQNPKTLAIAQRLIAGEKIPVVNPPALIPRTSRAEVAKRLAGMDGVVAPKVLMLRNPTRERVERQVRDAGFVFPAILRQTGTHNGQVVGIFPDLDSLAPIFGDRKNQYNLIEFVDVRHRDGFYRKTRFFFVGDQVITRQHIISDEWSVHGRSSKRILADHPDLIDEGRDKLINGFLSLPSPVRTAVDMIRQRIGLDYFGLDCCMMEDGRIVVFECNATMNFNPRFANPSTQHNRAALPRMVAALRRLIEAKTGKATGAPDKNVVAAAA